ncbi:GerA spore germination protein [Paenibacillus curdlanolyticus YK9]|uniref:GerA spore germination protein n=1 Tax=Paenibacillus curdlanolyticus YK9 TaxID=717606 RepID=E0IDP4_9BACL|nr:spore germination protein [Paenibacillus curdlanolyticus]EFM09248.1 GerA spore germination protein [Paenibacillus curdlanolyticus YK9]
MIRQTSQANPQFEQNGTPQPIERSLSAALHQLQQLFGLHGDMAYRSLQCDDGTAGSFIYNMTMSHAESIDQICGIDGWLHQAHSPALLIARIQSGEWANGMIHTTSDWQSVLHAIVRGDAVLLLDGLDTAIVCETRQLEWRSITEPTTQVVVRGPKDSFTESFATNISLIRRRVQKPGLMLETYRIGSVTGTQIGIMFVNGKAEEALLQTVRTRLQSLQTDGVLDSGSLERLMQEKRFTPFPTIYNTERPDSVVSLLLSGRVAIIVDGTPFVLVVPVTFYQFFRAAEDAYERADIGILLTVLRYVAYIVSLLGPSLYIAAITFHQEMIPTPLLISLVAQREGVPFPAFAEAMLMEVSFELMREAGVRMPRAVGQAVSIVGALILGQSAVQAGIVSAAMVIVVASTGIASFTSPAFNIAISARILRFSLMVLAGTFGLFGILIGLIFLVAHLCSLRSFGTPYMALHQKKGMPQA